MEDLLLNNLNNILDNKLIEIENILNSKKKININNNNDIDYNTKKTLGKINAELKKKYESSSAFKKKNQIF